MNKTAQLNAGMTKTAYIEKPTATTTTEKANMKAATSKQQNNNNYKYNNKTLNRRTTHETIRKPLKDIRIFKESKSAARSLG